MQTQTENKPQGFGRVAIEPAFMTGRDLVWERDESCELETNVRWRVRHHSPTGFEIGYAGSGVADLALNAMAALFAVKDDDPVECFDGKVSREAWHLHQPFKFHFLASADRQGGRIAWADIEAWLKTQEQPEALTMPAVELD
jgi:hypothetical protein